MIDSPPKFDSNKPEPTLDTPEFFKHWRLALELITSHHGIYLEERHVMLVGLYVEYFILRNNYLREWGQAHEDEFPNWRDHTFPPSSEAMVWFMIEVFGSPFHSDPQKFKAYTRARLQEYLDMLAGKRNYQPFPMHWRLQLEQILREQMQET